MYLVHSLYENVAVIYYYVHLSDLLIIKDTVVGIQALAELACSRSVSKDQNLKVNVMSNQTSYSFEPITKDNNELLQRAEVS